MALKKREKKNMAKEMQPRAQGAFPWLSRWAGAREKRPGHEVERHADSREIPRILLFLFPAISHFLKFVVHLRSQVSLDLYTLFF